MTTRYPNILIIVLLLSVSLWSEAVQISWTGRYSQGTFTFYTIFDKNDNSRIIRFDIPPNIPRGLRLIQSGPYEDNQSQNLLELMVRALGHAINAKLRSGYTLPQINNHPVSLEIFPLHWMQALPFPYATIIDQFHYLPNTVYVNLGYFTHHHEGSTEAFPEFYMGVILHLHDSIFHMIVTTYTLDDSSAAGTIQAAFSIRPQVFSGQPHFHANLNNLSINALTGLIMSNYWPLNLIFQPNTISLPPPMLLPQISTPIPVQQRNSNCAAAFSVLLLIARYLCYRPEP